MMLTALEMSPMSLSVSILQTYIQTAKWLGRKKQEFYVELLQVMIIRIMQHARLTLANPIIDSSAERCTEEHTNKTFTLGRDATNLTAGR